MGFESGIRNTRIIALKIFIANIFFVQVLFGQNVSDSTQIQTADSSNNKKSGSSSKSWNAFDTKITTLKFGGGFLYDGVTHIQDDTSKAQIPCETAFKTRDIRVTANGTFHLKREFISWKFGYMYDGVTDKWFVRETGLMFELPKISGRIFIGRTKEGFSMNKIMVGYAGWTMERQMAIDVIPILADGIKYLGYFPKQKIFLNLGAFSNWTSKTQSFSTYEWQFIARIGGLPIYSPDKKKVLHIAANLRYGKPVDNKIKLRSRPESNPSPFFIDTGTFPADYSYHYGLEAYYSSGPWSLGGEYYFHQFISPTTNDPMFHGGEFMVSYFLTGESRAYNLSINAYGFVPVKRSVFKGGPGAWEVVVRMTNLDLDAGTLTGGTFWRFTPTINWYLSNNIRLELVYGYGSLDRFGKIGKTQFFQGRIQFLL